MQTSNELSRRAFIRSNLAAALAASAFPTIIPSSALGKDGAVAPSERVVLGAIGVGDRGQDVLKHFLLQKECQVVAVCDVKRDVLSKAKGFVDDTNKNNDCAAIADFRELTARKDVDAVMVASTDHWHVLHALAAVRANKDVYVEKPLGLSLGQDQALREEVLRRKRVFQFGTQQRSDRKFRVACELVRNGHIGKLKHINVWAPPSAAGGSTKAVTPPATLDYNFWLGPAPSREHTENLTQNVNWWHVSDFALGFIAGWAIHPLDIALWGAGALASGVVEVAGRGDFPKEGLHDTATAWNIDLQFTTGLTMKSASTLGQSTLTEPLGKEWTARYGPLRDHGTVFEGDRGWVLVDRETIVTKPEALIELQLDPGNFPKTLVHSADHARNFLEAVKSRQTTVSPIESAVQADALCHVSDIAIRLGRKLRYDVDAEHFLEDQEANRRLLVRPMREPWKI